MNNEMKKGALLSYFSIAFNVVSGLIYTPWLIYHLGQGDYGVYIVASTTLSYFLFDFGLGESIAKFVSDYKLNKTKLETENFISLIFKLYLILTFLILIAFTIMLGCSRYIFLGLSTLELTKLTIVLIISGSYIITTFPFTPLNGIFISHEKFVFLKICDLINRIFSVAFGVIAIYFDGGLYGVVAAQAIVGIVVIVVKLLFYKKKLNYKIHFSFFDIKTLKEVFKFSIWMTITTFAQRLIIPITPIILAAVSSSIDISVFAIATTLEGYVFTIANALNGMFVPRLTEYSSKKEDHKIFTLVLQVGKIQIFILGLVLTGLVVFGKDFISLWVGEKFSSAYYMMLLIALPDLIIQAQSVITVALIVKNKIKGRAIIYLVSSILCTLLSCVLSSYYGAIGACVAICACLVLAQIIAMNVLYKKVLDFNIKDFFYQCIITKIPSLAVSILFGLFINIKGSSSFIEFVPKIVIYSIVYVLLFWIFGLNKNEKLQLQAKFSSRSYKNNKN